MNTNEIITRLKELQAKCLPDYDANPKILWVNWNLETPDALELSQMIIDLEDSMVDALTELEEIKKVVKNWDEGEYYTDSIHSMQKIKEIIKGESK